MKARAVVLFAVMALPAYTATITVGSVSGSFSNAQPLGLATIFNGSPSANDAEIWWGDSGVQGVGSGYRFDAIVPPAVSVTIPPNPSNFVQLADFTHINQPIPSGTAITGVDLAVNMSFTVDGNPVNQTFNYHITHLETSNATPCPAFQLSATPCDDRVTVSGPSSGTFTIGNVVYTLVLSFQQNNQFTNDFITEEQKSNTAGLYGRFSSRVEDVPAPEPASFLLLGAGLLVIASLRRRLKEK